jgi:hypothetical protein
MDLQKFIDERDKHPQFLEPCLYCILQDAGIKQPNGTFIQNNKFRCGTSGTKMFADADLTYRSGDSSSTGLISRANLYMGFFRPFSGVIYAALRVPKALVAESRDRTAEDTFGNIYNVDRANTLARVREKEYHAELDRRGLRFQKGRELFQTNNVENIISAMRTVKGIEMYTFDKNGPVFDEKYKGGSRRERISITETQPRQNPQRESKAPSLTITLSKEFLQQLRSGNPLTFQKLVNLVREFDEQKKQTTTVTAPKEAVQEIRQDSDRGRQLLDQVVNKRPVRRSPRLVELDDTTTQATIEAPRRRSPRLAAK